MLNFKSLINRGASQESMQTVIGKHVLNVGSIDAVTANSDFSDYGYPVVELWAPGRNWTSLDPSGGTTSGLDGTSFSAPTVSGAAALVLSKSANSATVLHDQLVNTGFNSVTVKCGGAVKENNRTALDANQAVQ